MIATSTAVMFVVTYSNTYDVGHIHFSQERLYMALLMGGAMASVMLSSRVRELADGIIKTQRLEITAMEWLLQDIEENGLATTEQQAEQRPIPDLEASAIRCAACPTTPNIPWPAEFWTLRLPTTSTG